MYSMVGGRLPGPTMHFVDDLGLVRAFALKPMLNPSEPGAQLLEESSASCPFQLDHDGSIRKGRL